MLKVRRDIKNIDNTRHVKIVGWRLYDIVWVGGCAVSPVTKLRVSVNFNSGGGGDQMSDLPFRAVEVIRAVTHGRE